MNDHDALTFMYKEEMEDEVIPKTTTILLTEEIPFNMGVPWPFLMIVKPDGIKAKYDSE